MITKRSDLNGKVYGRQDREMLVPKERISRCNPKEYALPCSDPPDINSSGFRRSPHLQAVMNRIEERRKSDRENEIRWQATSRRHHITNNYNENEYGEAEDNKGDLSDVLEVFAKYDNMLEHLVLKNMELVSLADRKRREIPNDETVLTEKVLKDLRALRQFREEELEHQPLQHSSLLTKDECKNPFPTTTRNPHLQFKRQSALLEGKQKRTLRSRYTPRYSQNQFVVCDDEIVDNFRPPHKSVTETDFIPESKDLLETSQSRAGKIRELREHRRKQKKARALKLEDAFYKTNKGNVRACPRRKGDSEIRGESQGRKYRMKEERLTGHQHQVTEPRVHRVARYSLGEAQALRDELEEIWCACPLDLPPESNPRPPRRSRKVSAEIDTQTDESDSESFGPARKARQLKERLHKIAKQSQSLKHAQDEMRGEMLQLQHGYKQKHNKLKRKFLRNAAPPKHHQNETREIEDCFTPSKIHGHSLSNRRNGRISYEVRDGIIVLDDTEEEIDAPEFEFLGVQSSKHMPDLAGGKCYMEGPVVPAPDEIHAHIDQDFSQQPVMELPFTLEEQAQCLEAEWAHDFQRVGALQPLSHIEKEGNYTDDDDSLSYDSTHSAYTQEHNRIRRELDWNCATER